MQPSSAPGRARLQTLRSSLASGFRDASGLREGHEFTRAAKSLKLCPRFSARGDLLALSASFFAASSIVPQAYKTIGPSREATAYDTPEPALRLSKGRTGHPREGHDFSRAAKARNRSQPRRGDMKIAPDVSPGQAERNGTKSRRDHRKAGFFLAPDAARQIGFCGLSCCHCGSRSC
jgi:hypothetical protein